MKLVAVVSEGEAVPDERLGAARAALLRALALLGGVSPRVADRHSVRYELAEALRWSGIAARARPGPELRDALPSATEHVRRALERLQTLGEDERRDEVLAHVARGLAGLLDATIPWDATGSERPPLNRVPASVGRLRALSFERPVLRPLVPLAEPPPIGAIEVDPSAPGMSPPTVGSLAELQAFMASAQADLARFEGGDAPAPSLRHDSPPPPPPPPSPLPPVPDADEAFHGRALDPREVLRERAQSCFVELAMFGVMRRPDPGDRWYELEPVEERLLARLDAILACGPEHLHDALATLDGRPVPDPELLWAAMVLLGTLEGEDAIEQMLVLLESADLAHPDVADAIADALALAPSGAIDLAILAHLASSPDVRRRVVVAHALARRGSVGRDVMLRDAAPEVLVEAGHALERAPESPQPSDLAFLTQHRDARVAEAGVGAALAHAHAIGVRSAAARWSRGPDEHWALVYLALGGDAETARSAIATAWSGAPSPGLIEATGWLGDVTFVPRLLRCLGDGEIRALAALQRITGASLTEDEPARTYDERERPFSAGFPWPDGEDELTPDAEAWRAWWASYGSRVERGARVRFGRPWCVEACVHEVESMAAMPRERRLAWLELVVRAGVRERLDVEAFVAVQKRQVAAIRAGVTSAGPWATRWRMG